MLARYVVPVVICIAATLALWVVVEKTRPVFRTVAIEKEGAAKGGFSGEMLKEYNFEMLKCDMVSFGIWGAALGGLTGLLANPSAKSRGLGLAVGVVLGAGAGALGAYLGQVHEARTEYAGASSTYWMLRWAAIIVPVALVSSIASALSGSLRKQFVDCLVGGLLGVVVGVVVYSLLHGVATPLEKPTNIYPGWSSNRILAMLSLNLGVFISILFQAGRVQIAKATEPVAASAVNA